MSKIIKMVDLMASTTGFREGTRRAQVQELLEMLLPGEPLLVNINAYNIKSLRVLICGQAKELDIKVGTAMQPDGHLKIWIKE